MLQEGALPQHETQRPEMFDRPIHAETINISLDTLAELPGTDPVEDKLHRAGVLGAPVAAFKVRDEEHVIVDLSAFPPGSGGKRSIFLDGYGPMAGASELPDTGDMPALAIVHLRGGGWGGVDVRPLLAGHPVLYGRDSQRLADEGDPGANTFFNYGTDPSVSRFHAGVLLDAKTRTIQVTDHNSSNKTGLRYMHYPEQAGADLALTQGSAWSHQEAAPVVNAEVEAMTQFTQVVRGELADVLSKPLTDGGVDLIEAVADGGSRLANALLTAGNMRLPEKDSLGRENMQRMIDAAGVAIRGWDQPRTKGEFDLRFQHEHLLQKDLMWLLSVMSEVPGSRRRNRGGEGELYAAHALGAYGGKLLTFMEDVSRENGRAPISDAYQREKMTPIMQAYDRVRREAA